ncbi:MAG: DUF1109 domain-containing protein [Pseudomonadota bacterium]
MKTDDLIDLLSRGSGPAPRAVAARRLLPVAALGLVASALLAAWVMGWVPTSLYAQPAPWFKLGYAGLLAAASAWAAAWLARPLSRPLWRLQAPGGAVAAVLLAAGAVGLADWLATPVAERGLGLMGHSWAGCPLSVLLLSLPALAAALWALRGLAPTRPVAAGAAAGLFAGSLGAFGYALACDELALSFVAAWYTLGIALVVATGAWLGPRVLRW